jgi:protocatechuate 3,4-dioxygenase beta subunit
MDVDGMGIPGATITLSATRIYDEGPVADNFGVGLNPVTTTDSSGFYAFPGLPQGDFEVRVAAQETYGPARITVRSGVRNADIVMASRETKVVEGEVRGPDGEPLEGVIVAPVLVGVPGTRTDAQGEYSLSLSLKPGTAAVTFRFQFPGFVERQAAVDLVGSGSMPRTLDVELQPADYWTNVSGTVSDGRGEPLANKVVSLRQLDSRRVHRVKTDERGRYTFDAVQAPLSYVLDVSGAPDHKDFRKRVEVTTEDAELDIVVEPFEFGRVSGRLVNADGEAISNFSLVLKHVDSSSASAVVRSDPEGNFEIPRAPAGDLVVSSQSSPSIFVQGLRLEEGDELQLPLVLDWGAHELQGIVVDHNNLPVPAARVVLSWSHVEDGVTTITTRRSATDAQGGFHFTDLGPGPHSIQVDSPGRRPVIVAHDVSRQGYSVMVNLR